MNQNARLSASRDTARPDEHRKDGPTGPGGRVEGRHTVELLAVSALGLVPWTVVLGLTLPSDYRVHAWSTAWVGFDVMLLAAMAATAVLGMRRRRTVVIPALVTAVLLVCDAWFDIALDVGTPGMWTSAALAVFVELPMAGFLFRKAYSLLRRQWEAEGSAAADGAAPGAPVSFGRSAAEAGADAAAEPALPPQRPDSSAGMPDLAEASWEDLDVEPGRSSARSATCPLRP